MVSSFDHCLAGITIVSSFDHSLAAAGVSFGLKKHDEQKRGEKVWFLVSGGFGDRTK